MESNERSQRIFAESFLLRTIRDLTVFLENFSHYTVLLFSYLLKFQFYDKKHSDLAQCYLLHGNAEQAPIKNCEVNFML